MRGWLTIFVIFTIGYFAGAAYPSIANRVGVGG